MGAETNRHLKSPILRLPIRGVGKNPGCLYAIQREPTSDSEEKALYSLLVMKRKGLASDEDSPGISSMRDESLYRLSRKRLLPDAIIYSYNIITTDVMLKALGTRVPKDISVADIAV